MEVFDIVDYNDIVIGRASRDEVHGNPSLRHRVSHVLVFNPGGKLFLQKRALSKDVQPGKWDTSVGGHLDEGESYLKGAQREMKEELGICTDLEFLYKYTHSNSYETEVVSTFMCVWEGEVTINPDEISDGRFWDLDEIQAAIDQDLFTPNFLDELKRYLNHQAEKTIHSGGD